MLKTILLIFIISFTNLYAEHFIKKATSEPILIQKGKEKLWCPVCGMNIKMFYKTSHAAQLKNGTKRQYCSLRCLVVDMQEYGIDKNTIYVVDAKSEQFIKAKDAFYLVGSRIKGTMSRVSKLAFKTKEEAKEFKKKYKGKIVDFDTALKMAKESLKTDLAMIKKKKEKKVYPKGKKIFEARCNQNIDLNNFIEINELKSAIKYKQLCKPLKEKQLQAVAIYLWDIKRFGDLKTIKDRVKVSKDEKCPVCGMFTYKYPRWAAQIFYTHNDHKHHLSFDGVKDLMKFYFSPNKWGKYNNIKQNITKILVTDYYTQKGIDGTKAYYVIGSNVYGPMGNELIPFENIEDAKIFKSDHYGTKILTFDDIKENLLYKLDEN